LRLSSDQISFLFTADIGQETEKRLVRQRAELSCTAKQPTTVLSGSTSQTFIPHGLKQPYFGGAATPSAIRMNRY
jgi:hypothetical protein